MKTEIISLTRFSLMMGIVVGVSLAIFLYEYTGKTVTTTIVVEKEECDALGGELTAFSYDDGTLDIFCDSVQENLFEYNY